MKRLLGFLLLGFVALASGADDAALDEVRGQLFGPWRSPAASKRDHLSLFVEYDSISDSVGCKDIPYSVIGDRVVRVENRNVKVDGTTFPSYIAAPGVFRVVTIRLDRQCGYSKGLTYMQFVLVSEYFGGKPLFSEPGDEAYVSWWVETPSSAGPPHFDGFSRVYRSWR